MKNLLNLILILLLMTINSGCNGGGGGDDQTPQDRVAIEDINFEDADFKKHILSTGLSYADELTSISYTDAELASLVGLENFSNLTDLDLSNNRG